MTPTRTLTNTVAETLVAVEATEMTLMPVVMINLVAMRDPAVEVMEMTPMLGVDVMLMPVVGIKLLTRRCSKVYKIQKP